MDNNLNALKGYKFMKLYIRDAVVTYILMKDDKVIGLNILGCFAVEDNGVIGKVLNEFSFSRMGIKHKLHCIKLGMNPEENHSLWVSGVDSRNDKIKSELFCGCASIDIDVNIDIYNPISEDKYNENR